MLVLAVLLSLIVLVVSLTVVFVAVKLFAHFRAVAQAEEDGRLEADNNIIFGSLDIQQFLNIQQNKCLGFKNLTFEKQVQIFVSLSNC